MLLALETDPHFAPPLTSAQRRRDHSDAASRADGWVLFIVHTQSISARVGMTRRRVPTPTDAAIVKVPGPDPAPERLPPPNGDRAGAWCQAQRGYRASMREVLPGVFHWTTLHPRIHIDVSSYWLDRAGVAIDPLVPSERGLEWFAERTSSPKAVLLSNRHHYRDSDCFVEAFGCSVHCNRAGLHEFSHGEAVEGFEPGDTLPGGVLACEVGGICPDETALYLPEQRAVALADGVVRGRQGSPPGFVPDSLMDDPPGTKRALLAAYARLLDQLDFEHLLLAHGDPLIGDGRAALQELVASGGRTAFELDS